ncbi:protein trichome berefringence-like 7 [Gossypium arboreum]|uniref:protein trichome berefringence-like 7 n=1 Tax=Gossypium arboreum TaxID=29729 RepID=UPI0022F1CE75|nr:protein trichome berefringence-like 7 [Gossypium arboreum]
MLYRLIATRTLLYFESRRRITPRDRIYGTVGEREALDSELVLGASALYYHVCPFKIAVLTSCSELLFESPKCPHLPSLFHYSQLPCLQLLLEFADARLRWKKTTPGSAPRHAPKRVKSTVKLDKLDDMSKEWIDSDFLIFNSGHWWTPTKLFDMGRYFQAGRSLKLGMGIASAFRTALETWVSWVESSVNRNRTRVFFRTFESSHWIGRNRNSCKVTRRPWLKTKGRDHSRISDIIIDVVKKMTTPVTVLHVTPMGAFRSDAHVGTWSDKQSVADCSHWCLPGVPDTWNEILLSMMLSKDGVTVQ